MRFFLLLILCNGILLITNCKPDKEECHDPANPKCENYDPCYGKKPVTAEIEIAQRMHPFVSGVYSLDTVFPISELRFQCLTPNVKKCTWVLGAETITDKIFTRSFGQVPYGVYSVTLIVEKDPDTNCFPNDNGLDTLTRYFTIAPMKKLLTFGKFLGKWDGVAGDSSIITLYPRDFNNKSDTCDWCTLFFTNLSGNNDTTPATNGAYVSNTKLMYYRPGDITIDSVEINVDRNTLALIMRYKYASKFRTFRGRRFSD